MVFQSVPNGIEIVLKGVQDGIPINNVFNVQDTTTHDPARLNEIADVVFTWWQTNVRPGQSPGYTLNQIIVTSLELATGPQVTVNLSTGNVGTATGGAMAANAALVVSWRTASIGRSFRGRTYFGGLAQSALDSAHTFGSTTIAGFSTAGTNLIDVLNAIGVQLCVLSRYANKVLRVVGLLTEIVSVVVDAKVDSQRRRTAN